MSDENIETIADRVHNKLTNLVTRLTASCDLVEKINCGIDDFEKSTLGSSDITSAHAVLFQGCEEALVMKLATGRQ